MKVLWKGNVFNPTGIATASREIVKALVKKEIKIQCADIWNSGYDFNEGLHFLNNAIDVKDVDCTIFADYPQFWRDGYGKIIGYFLHEGTKLHQGWAEILNTADLVLVPSQATKNLFRFNGVLQKIEIVPFGVNPEMYYPKKFEDNEDYLFLSVNSWTGKIDDRKGTDVLIKAFDEEFKDEKVKLMLKISTFWQKIDIGFYANAIYELLGHTNPNILINEAYVPEKELTEFYQKSDCFVMPTRGEGFGLTAINAMASGLPLIITKDNNSGHMDFCRGKDSVLWIDADKMEQADKRFFAEGNLQPLIDKESLKKQMRYAFEHKKELKEKALINSEDIRKKWSWENSAKKLIEVLKNGK
jgi:glycosyltransferase involved in cell wall biosynthesis